MAYTEDIGLRDLYNYYKDTSIERNKRYVDYKTYSKIIKEANLITRNKIIYESETLVMPFKLGNLRIYKFENTYTLDNKKSWKVNYKLTKELGHLVYHGAKFGYKWKWFKPTCRVKGKRWYTFKPCRAASRLIADAINNKQLDFYSK